MPTLPTYTASADTGYQLGYYAGGRRAQASDFGGDGLSVLAKGAEKAYDTISAGESRKALIATTELRAQYAKRLDDAAQTGEDLAPIKEQMNNDFAKLGENLYTPAGQSELRLHVAQTNAMFDQQANAINVHLAGVRAKVDAGKFLNGTAALLNTTPSYLPTALADADALAATFTGATAAQRAEIADHLKNQLNVAAAVASARLDPAATISRLEAGDWDLTPQQREEAINHAKTTQRAMRADEDHARALKEYNEREADEAARDDLFKGIIGGTTKPGDIMNDARLKPTTREHLIMFQEARAKELASQEKKSDPVVMRNLWTAINAPQGDPRKVYDSNQIFQAVQRGDINTRDADYLNNLVAQQKDENGRTIGSKLGGLMSIVDRALSQDPKYIGQPALVAEIQMDYQYRVYQKVEAMRAAGQDPNELFNPASKDFVGSKEFIQGSVDGVSARSRASTQTMIDLRQTPNAEIPVGAPFINSKGQQAVMSQAAFEARRKATEASQSPNMLRSDQEKQVDQLYSKGAAPSPAVGADATVPAPAPPRQVEYERYVAASTAYGEALDEFTKINGQKNPDPDQLRAARVKMQDLKAKSAAAHDAWQSAAPAPTAPAAPQDEYFPDRKWKPGEWTWLFNGGHFRAEPDPDMTPQKREKLLGEIATYRSIAQNGKNDEAKRDDALREMVGRYIILGYPRAEIDQILQQHGKSLQSLRM